MNDDRVECGLGVDPALCPAVDGANVDSYMPTDMPVDPLQIETVRLCSQGTIDLRQRDGMQATRATPMWHQSMVTVFPPGTVAVLPVTPGTPIDGDFADYSWRVNRAHVVTHSIDIASDIIVPNMSSSSEYAGGTGRDDSVCMVYSPEPGGLSSAVPGIRVLLDDPWCVSARNCTPDVGQSTWSSTPSLVDVLNRYASSDAVRGLFSRARLGCAVAYDTDHTIMNVDLLPSDMPSN